MNERKKKIENLIIRIKSVSRKCHFDSKWTEIPFVVCACWLATPNTKQKTPPNKNRCEIMKKRNGIIKCGCFDKIYDSHCFNWLKWKCVHTANTNKITGQNSSAHVYGWTFNCFAAIFYRFFFCCRRVKFDSATRCRKPHIEYCYVLVFDIFIN